jgi:hypothetical protein
MIDVRVVLLASALLIATPAFGNERGTAIRAGDIYAEPFIDAAKVGTLAANQPVTIVARKGGWLSVDAGGKRGWVRLLIVRLVSASPVAAAGSTTKLRTGSTGRTVTTGIKGLDEADIRNAAVDRAQLAEMDSLASSDPEARDAAQGKSLTETKVKYLKAGKGS